MKEIYPFIVAELSANHHGSLERAIKIVEAAKEAGADAVKLQTYLPNSMAADNGTIGSGTWQGKRLRDLYQEAHTPLEWHEALFKRAREIGIFCFSTPFDEYAVDFLETFNCPMYKVASFEITDLNLIRYIAQTGKPMIMSTGMATAQEIKNAIDQATDSGCIDITILKCTSAYPSKAEDANLLTMLDIQQEHGVHIGVSDHSQGNAVPITAAIMGAMMIEKHLKLDDQPGPDSSFSLTPDQFKTMVEEVQNACDSVGEVRYGPTKSEKDNIVFRRSLYIIKPMKAGETITSENCKARRPNVGIQADKHDSVMGRRIKQDADIGTPLKWDMLTNENDNLQ